MVRTRDQIKWPLPNGPTRHSTREKKKGKTKEKMGRQHQRVDRSRLQHQSESSRGPSEMAEDCRWCLEWCPYDHDGSGTQTNRRYCVRAYWYVHQGNHRIRHVIGENKNQWHNFPKPNNVQRRDIWLDRGLPSIFCKFIIKTGQSESHFTRELNNQPHSHPNATTFYALLFCFHTIQDYVLQVLQYSMLYDVPLGKKKSAGSRMQGSCFFSPSKSCYFLLN